MEAATTDQFASCLKRTNVLIQATPTEAEARLLQTLEALGYGAEHDESEGVTVWVPADAHPLTGFELAMIAQDALAHELFDLQVVGSDGPDAPLELFLGTPDADMPPPLWRRVEVPEDYFILTDGLPRVVLKFDFDAPEGILLHELAHGP